MKPFDGATWEEFLKQDWEGGPPTPHQEDAAKDFLMCGRTALWGLARGAGKSHVRRAMIRHLQRIEREEYGS